MEDKKPITPEEWNKLNADEKNRRVEDFNAHIEGYEKEGIAWGRSDLIRLAITYGVPIPTGFDKNNKPIFEGFN